MRGLRGKAICRGLRNAAALVFFAGALAAGEAAEAPRFLKAKPVWPKDRQTERNTFFGFRACVDAPAATAAVLRVTGCSDYRVSLNGDFLAYGPARAAKGFFRVDEIALSLARGTNIVAIEAAGYNCNSFYLMDQPSFLQAEVVCGGSVLAATTAEGGAFEARALPRLQKVVRYSFQRPFGEAYRLAPGFDDWKKRPVAAGEPVPLAEQPAVALLPRRAPYPRYGINGPFRALSCARVVFDAEKATQPVRFVDAAGVDGRGKGFAKEELTVNWYDLVQRFSAVDRAPLASARESYALAEGRSVLFDAGLNDTGFLGVRIRCLRPGTLAIKFDEILVEGEVSPTRYSCANVVAWELTEPGVYEVESFEPYAFRYADVLVRDGAFEISAPYLRTYKNPEVARARLESSDPALEKIFRAAGETYAQNAVDVFSDCPGRERAGWNCDAYFTARASLLLTGSLDLEDLYLENYLLPARFDHLPEGMFPMCYPADFPNGEFIPNWAMWMVLQIEEYKNRGGDPAIVAAFRPKLLKLVDYLKTFRNSDGLLEKLPRWVFIEWSRANQLVQDVNYPSNMLWAEMLDAMDRLYRLPALAAEAAQVRRTIVAQAWNGRWFCDNAVRGADGELKLSGECTEVCQYYAFYFKVATARSHPELWKTLVADFGPRRAETKKHPEVWPANAFIGNYLRLECLSRAGLSAQILAETRDYFLYMADRTGTLWEHITTEASCNHGFASHVAVTLWRDFVGVRKMDRRTKEVVFSPPADLPLDFLSMTLPIDDGRGEISAGWKKENGRLVPHLRLPPGWRRAK